jgi:hypothetical protein
MHVALGAHAQSREIQLNCLPPRDTRAKVLLNKALCMGSVLSPKPDNYAEASARRRLKSKPMTCQRGRAHDGDSQISDADCLIPLDNFRAAGGC